MIKVPLSCGAPIRERNGGGGRIGNYTEGSKNCFLEDFFCLPVWGGMGGGRGRDNFN